MRRNRERTHSVGLIKKSLVAIVSLGALGSLALPSAAAAQGSLDPNSLPEGSSCVYQGPVGIKQETGEIVAPCGQTHKSLAAARNMFYRAGPSFYPAVVQISETMEAIAVLENKPSGSSFGGFTKVIQTPQEIRTLGVDVDQPASEATSDDVQEAADAAGMTGGSWIAYQRALGNRIGFTDGEWAGRASDVNAQVSDDSWSQDDFDDVNSQSTTGSHQDGGTGLGGVGNGV